MSRLAVLLLLLLLALPGTGCAPRDLASVEIREYEGQKLSSIYDFRENSIKGPQRVDISDYRLKVSGLVREPKTYTYEEALANQRYKKVTILACVEGWAVNILWEGILVKDLLAKSAPLPSARVIIFHAYDGYTTSLPLEYITGKDILMAYRMNGVDLPAERGYPFELVAESKWGYKWIKWIVEIELSDNVSYRGYWETRGYSNNGDLDKGYFDE